MLAVACAAIAAGACGLGREARTLQRPASGTPDGTVSSERDRARLAEVAGARRAAPADTGYHIGPDDLLEVRIPDLLEVAAPVASRGGETPAVAGAPVFQQGLRVGADGIVKIPSLGPVLASGRTPAELEDDIARRLVAADLLRHPQVSVVVAEYRGRVVAVTGAVERPGLYPLTRPGARLSDFLWTAGGPKSDAGRVVEFVPAGEEAHGPIRIDLEVLARPGTTDGDIVDAEARPGDVLKVAPAGSVLVDGWVERPGAYPITRGLTVGGAVAAAGGNVFAGDRRKVEVRRATAPGEDGSFMVDLEAIAKGQLADVPVVDGDVVRLPVHTARIVPYVVWVAAREMVHVGGSLPLF